MTHADPTASLQVLFWKKRAEEELQRSGLDYTIVRPGRLQASITHPSPAPPSAPNFGGRDLKTDCLHTWRLACACACAWALVIWKVSISVLIMLSSFEHPDWPVRLREKGQKA